MLFAAIKWWKHKNKCQAQPETKPMMLSLSCRLIDNQCCHKWVLHTCDSIGCKCALSWKAQHHEFDFHLGLTFTCGFLSCIHLASKCNTNMDVAISTVICCSTSCTDVLVISVLSVLSCSFLWANSVLEKAENNCTAIKNWQFPYTHCTHAHDKFTQGEFWSIPLYIYNFRM